jgi:hypothetical protein
MSDNTKIMLSSRELAIVTDKEFILTKHRIIQQVFALFQQQVPVIQQYLQTFWNSQLGYDRLPRISKGDQYRQLPYVVMDYPAVFNKQDRMAIRTLFLWGDSFSVTLHLAGKYKMLFWQQILNNLMQNRTQLFYVSVSKNEWEHHFEADNYQLLSDFSPSSLSKQLEGSPFIKIALRYPLAQWNEMERHFVDAYRSLSDLLKGKP